MYFRYNSRRGSKFSGSSTKGFTQSLTLKETAYRRYQQSWLKGYLAGVKSGLYATSLEFSVLIANVKICKGFFHAIHLQEIGHRVPHPFSKASFSHSEYFHARQVFSTAKSRNGSKLLFRREKSSQ